VAGAVHRASWRSCTQSILAELQRASPPLPRGCLSCGRRSAQSILEALRRAWPSLARGGLSCGRRKTQSILAELRRVWPPLAALAFAWQAHCTSFLAELWRALPLLAGGGLSRG